MIPGKSALAGAAILVGATFAAEAQPQYRPPPQYQRYPFTRDSRPPSPPAWRYDPYTDGTVPAPQHGGGP